MEQLLKESVNTENLYKMQVVLLMHKPSHVNIKHHIHIIHCSLRESFGPDICRWQLRMNKKACRWTVITLATWMRFLFPWSPWTQVKGVSKVLRSWMTLPMKSNPSRILRGLNIGGFSDGGRWICIWQQDLHMNGTRWIGSHCSPKQMPS